MIFFSESTCFRVDGFYSIYQSHLFVQTATWIGTLLEHEPAGGADLFEGIYKLSGAMSRRDQFLYQANPSIFGLPRVDGIEYPHLRSPN